MAKKGPGQLPYNLKPPGQPPVIRDRSSSLSGHQPLNVSPKRPREIILEEIENAKRQRLAAKASRDSLNQLDDAGWWTQDKIIHQASVEELQAKIELERTTPQKSAQAFEDSISKLKAALSEEVEAAAASREVEVRKEVALLKAAQLEREKIKHGTLTQSTNAFLSITAEILFPEDDKRTKGEQKTFKVALCVKYNALLDTKPSSMIGKGLKAKKLLCANGAGAQAWCPVTQVYMEMSRRTAAHIVPHRLGQKGFELFYGKDLDEFNSSTWSLRNGLILDSDIERLFDEGVVVMTPCSSDPDETEFETRVVQYDRLNDRIHSGDSSRCCERIHELHGRKLVFKNHSRPGKRYLYLMYCTALYKANREGKYQVIRKELRDGKDIWATPGRYIRENMLSAMAANMGHDASKLHADMHAIPSGEIKNASAAAAEVSEYNKVAKTLIYHTKADDDDDKVMEGFDAYDFLQHDTDWAKYD